MSKFVYGIDLGTTYSCISYVDETGRATVISNYEGINITPSVVSFSSPTAVVVGQVAKENAVIEPQNTVSLVKSLMGKSDFAINYNGRDISPEEVSSFILRKLTEDAAKALDTEVKDVVITCPAYFGSAERTATKNAGVIAELNVLEIISEPTAAAIYYGCTKEQEEKTILVYDLGGGTFDVTIMAISSKIEVICSDGNHELGGKDWDDAIIRYLAEEFKSQTGYDGEFDEYAMQSLRLKAETAKQQLTSRPDTPVMLEVAGLRARISLSRDVFDSITSALLHETLEKTDAAIAVATEKGYKIDEILLVGGSTRMPQVTKALVEKYGMEPRTLEVDEAVAKGAAIHAVNVYVDKQEKYFEWKDKVSDPNSGDTDPEPPKDLDPTAYEKDIDADLSKISIGGKPRTVVVATTKSFAVQVMMNDQPKCFNMIVKNESMPDGFVSISETFGTYEANMDTADIIVYESDFMDKYYDVDEDYVLGTASLELPGNLPEGAPIEITFKLNSEGILEVTGRDLTSNKEVHATMRAKGIMAAEKVEELKEKSKNITLVTDFNQ